MGDMDLKITLWPDFIKGPIEAFVIGDELILNGESLDFSVIPDGYRLPSSAVDNRFFLEGSDQYVERINGEIHLTLRLPVTEETSDAILNPDEPIVISVVHGEVDFPKTTPDEPTTGDAIDD